MKELKLDVYNVTRIEGHGNIHLRVVDDKVANIKWEVVEPPRFFEVMLRGRFYEDVPVIASRICGHSSIAHTLASIQAAEAAFGVKLSEQTVLLRRLLYDAELIESHLFHLLFQVLPDFLGAPSIFSLIEKHQDIVDVILRLKKLASDLAKGITGRRTHPPGCIVGGFATMPDLNELKNITKRLEKVWLDFDMIINLFKNLNIPDFTRETEYIALKDPREYALISCDIASSDATSTPLNDYLDITKEFYVPWSTAKYTRHERESYMVGSLARFNLNHNQLHSEAKKIAAKLGLQAPNYNPYMISVAQVVEVIHALEDAINIMDRLSKRGLKDEIPQFKVRAGKGVGAIEAPCGTLFHDYAFDEKGLLLEANIITPPSQNNNNIQKDFEVLVPKILNQSEDEILLKLEMLVRAYNI